MWTLSAQSPCGWAFSSVTRPWVAHRVCPSPIVASGGAATATAPWSDDETGVSAASPTAARRLARLPTARTESMWPCESREMPAES